MQCEKHGLRLPFSELDWSNAVVNHADWPLAPCLFMSCLRVPVLVLHALAIPKHPPLFWRVAPDQEGAAFMSCFTLRFLYVRVVQWCAFPLFVP